MKQRYSILEENSSVEVSNNMSDDDENENDRGGNRRTSMNVHRHRQTIGVHHCAFLRIYLQELFTVIAEKKWWNEHNKQRYQDDT